MWIWANCIVGAFIVHRAPRRKHLMYTWSALILVNVGFVVSAQQYVAHGSTHAGVANVVFLWLYGQSFPLPSIRSLRH